MRKIEKAIEIIHQLTDGLNENGYVKRANDLAIQALQEKQERENPKPLTLEELKNMDGEPIWCEWILQNKRSGEWFLIAKDDNDPFGFMAQKPCEFGTQMCINESYRKIWLAYLYKPEHIGEATNMVEHPAQLG